MSYITISNALSILFETDIKSIEIEGSIYKKPIYFFNYFEVNRLLAIQKLIADPEEFLTSYYKPIEKKDSFTLVFEGKAPAFHHDANCERLNSDYKNFLIPEKIKRQGKTAILGFRNWFKENQTLLDKPAVFAMRFHLKWGYELNPKNIQYENSGISEFEDFSPKEIEEKIDELLKKAGKMYKENTVILSKYNKYSYLGFSKEPLKDNKTGFSDEEVKKVLRVFELEIKKKIMPIIISYYRVTLNKDLNLHENVLKQLGFVPCSFCCKNPLNSLKPTLNSVKPVKKPALFQTYDDTYQLIKRGFNIQEIAEQRELSTKTIIKHIIKLSSIYNKSEFERFKPSQETILKVRNAIAKIGSRDKLKPIFEELKEKISYEEIELVLIYLD